ncbi:MAG: HNH endonuclease [Fibrobacteres bacterium]|nr:HNH endonuclease [Fibrobacterota bacterium]
MATCYLCKSELSGTNESKEHIFLNAIGGRLGTKTILCRECNSSFGEKPDAELAKQLNFVSNMLNIRRERGTPPDIRGTLKSTGEQYLVSPEGKPALAKPSFEKTVEGETTVYQIKVRSHDELRKTMEGLKRHHPDINVDEIVNNAKMQTEPLSEMLHFQLVIGGSLALRSICKTAVNFYLFKGGEVKHIAHVIPYLKEETNLEIVNQYLDDSRIKTEATSSVSHSIFIIGDPKERILYTYIEFFSAFSFIVRLSTEYDGPAITESYSYDVLNEVETPTATINPIEPEFVRTYDYRRASLNFSKLTERLSAVLKIAVGRQLNNHAGSITKDAIANSLGKYPEGTVITEAMADELVAEMMKRIEPIIRRNLSD